MGVQRMDLLSALGVWIGSTWDLFTEINVPGFDFPIAVLFVGPFLALFGLRLLGMALGLDFGSGNSYGTSRAGKLKISKSRKNDER